MAAPAGFADLLQQKYNIQQQEATARSNLEGAQAASISAASPFENALKAAQAGQTRAQTATVDPLAQASIASTLAGVGEARARTNLFGAQTGQIQGGLEPIPDIGLQLLHRGLQAFSGNPQTPGVGAQPDVTGGSPNLSTVRSAVSPTAAPGASPGTAGSGSIRLDTNQGGYIDANGNRVQGFKKGTANVKKGGGGKMPAAPPPQLQPQASAATQLPSALPMTSPPMGPLGSLAGMLQAAMGANTVPGQGTGDKVPAMLEPGEAVVSRAGVKKLPGGRPAIAAANAKGAAEPQRGAPMRRPLNQGAVKKDVKPGNHVAVHIKMA